MKVNGRHYRAIWVAEDGWGVEVIDQRRLPHEFVVRRLETLARLADLPRLGQPAVVGDRPRTAKRRPQPVGKL